MITVRLKNLKEIRKTFIIYPKISAKHFQKAIKTSLLKIERRAKQKAPVDTGTLRAKWKLTVGFMRGSLEPTSKYASYVEYGAKPHWVGIKRIEGWARRHGISPYAVRMSIARKGTKKQPFLEPAVNTAEINREFEIAIDNILKEI